MGYIGFKLASYTTPLYAMKKCFLMLNNPAVSTETFAFGGV
jgi:hypothetical protein